MLVGSCGAQGRLALASHCTATASTWLPTEAAELDTVGGTGGEKKIESAHLQCRFTSFF